MPWARKAVVLERPTLSMNEVLDRFEVEFVEVTPGQEHILVVDKTDGEAYSKSFAARNAITPQHLGTEFSSASPSPWTAYMRREYLAELQGKQGLRLYDKMRRGDGTVRESLRLYKTPVLSARFFVEPGGKQKDGTIGTANQNVADFIWCNLTEWMSTPWTQTLTEALLMCDFGYYFFEKVFTPGTLTENRGKIIWQKMAPRHPIDVVNWNFDKTGGPVSVTMPDPNNGFDYVDVPIGKLLVFTFDKEANDISGISVLRSAYKHWYYKEQLYKIDAIQKERHGIGIPVIKLPLGYSSDDKTLANELGRNLRTNERAHVVLPPGWDLLFAELKGQPVDVIKSIEHHDKLIEKNVLGAFVSQTSGSDENHIMFLKSARFIADIITETFNTYAIPQLVDFNWTNVEYPKLKARRIGEQADWRTLSFAVRNLVGSGIIVPDDMLEDALRDEMDLPLRDPKTSRAVATPQNKNEVPPQQIEEDDPNAKNANPVTPPGPAPVGPPRQAAPGAKPGNSNAGGDKSGGK
jgi:hypothetical protein